MRVVTEALSSLKSPSSVWPAASYLPPVRGRLLICSNREKFAPLWDVWIHILGIRTECACWGAGGPVCRPYGGNVVSLGGAPSRRALQKGVAGTCSLIRPLRGHLSLSPLSLRDISP